MKDWKKAADEIVASRERPLKVFLLGATDSGKTTMAAFLATVAADAGLKAAVVDADVGQSEIGPPGCVGLGFPTGPVGRLREIPAAYSFFVGSNSPDLQSFTTALAAKMAVDRALLSEPDIVIIDTTGLVHGRTARFLKHTKIQMLRPTHIVALQRDLEVEQHVRPWENLGRPGLSVLRVPVSPKAADRSKYDRRVLRERAFRQYFAGATRHQVDLSKVALFRTAYLTGRPMDEAETRLISSDLRCPIAHAEWLPDGVFIVAAGYFELEGLERIKEREGVTDVFLTKADRFENLLTGLLDHSGDLLAVGILHGLDFRRRTAGLVSPLPPEGFGEVAGLELGILKVQPTGEEIGKIHPNDI